MQIKNKGSVIFYCKTGNQQIYNSEKKKQQIGNFNLPLYILRVHKTVKKIIR